MPSSSVECLDSCDVLCSTDCDWARSSPLLVQQVLDSFSFRRCGTDAGAVLTLWLSRCRNKSPEPDHPCGLQSNMYENQRRDPDRIGDLQILSRPELCSFGKPSDNPPPFPLPPPLPPPTPPPHIFGPLTKFTSRTVLPAADRFRPCSHRQGQS